MMRVLRPVRHIRLMIRHESTLIEYYYFLVLVLILCYLAMLIIFFFFLTVELPRFFSCLQKIKNYRYKIVTSYCFIALVFPL